MLSGEQSNTSVIVDDGELSGDREVLPGAVRGTQPRGRNRRGPDRRPAPSKSPPPWAGSRASGNRRRRWPANQPVRRLPPPDGPRRVNSPSPTSSLPAALTRGGWQWMPRPRAPDFTAEAHALGVATATVHRRLAEALGPRRNQPPGRDIAPGVAQRVRAVMGRGGYRRRDLRRGPRRTSAGIGRRQRRDAAADPRRPAPRPDPAGAGTGRASAALGHPGLRRRAAAAHRRTKLPGCAAAGRRRDAAVLRLRGWRRRSASSPGSRSRRHGWTIAPRRSWPATQRSYRARWTGTRRCSWHCGWIRRCTKLFMSCETGPDWLAIPVIASQSSPEQYRLRRLCRSRSGR